MSVERSFEAWEEVQRHGQELADRLAQGFTGLIQMNPPHFTWPNPPTSKLFDLEFPSQNFGKREFGLATENYGIDGVSAIFDIGNRIGQAGADLGASLKGLVQQFFRSLPMPFKHEDTVIGSVRMEEDKDRQRSVVGISMQEDLGTLSERLRDYGFAENDTGAGGLGDEEIGGFNLSSAGRLGRRQGIINITSTYDSRTQELEGSLVARGDLWRVEASHGGSTSGNENSSLFLVQLGPLLFVPDSTLLLPVHLSKQHLLWYGYDRKDPQVSSTKIWASPPIKYVYSRGVQVLNAVHPSIIIETSSRAPVIDIPSASFPPSASSSQDLLPAFFDLDLPIAQ